MKWLKSIIKKPATAVLLIASILTLIGVIAKGMFDLSVANLPIEATQTAESKSTSIINVSPVASPKSGDSISVGGDVEDSTIIQSGGGDINLAPTNPAFDEMLDSVEIEGAEDNVLVAYNQKGFPIWRESFETKISVATAIDFDKNGTTEVFVGLDMPENNTGFLIAYDEAGNKLGEIDVWKPSIYYGGAKEKSRIVDFSIVDLTGDGDNEVVIISNDIYWYASKLSVIEYSEGVFTVSAEYWNPGLLHTLDINDLENDGIKEIFVTGVNNDLQAVYPLGGNIRIVFMLEGDSIAGQAPPWFGNDDKGSEAWYGYILPNEGFYVTNIMFEDLNNDDILDIHLPLNDACSFYVDKTGQIIGYGRGTACKNESEFIMLP